MKTTKFPGTNLHRGVTGMAAIAIGLALLMSVMLVSAMLSDAQVRRGSRSTGPRQEIKAADYKITGPYTHNNLSVFLVHGEDQIKGKRFLTLQEALIQKKIVVYETKSVNELSIENRSSEEVYVQAGEIVKGGKQDRMLGVDLVVPPHSGRIPIAAFCVEAGRWTGRRGEQATVFASSSDSAATREIKLAAKVANSQGDVWKNVQEAQDKLSQNLGTRVNSSVSESSLQLAVENSRVRETADGYIRALANIVNSSNDVIGYAFAINGQVNSADVYASSGLFRKLWPKLLKASAIEAIAQLQKGQKFEPARKEDVRGFLAEPEDAQAKEKDVTSRIKVVTRETDENVFFETRDAASKTAGKDDWVHRNYIKKH